MGSPRPTRREHLLPSPLRVLAELSLPHVVDGTKTELVGARGHQALDHYRGSLGVHAGQEHGPGGIYKDRGWRQRWTSRGPCSLPQPRLGQQRRASPNSIRQRLVASFSWVPLAHVSQGVGASWGGSKDSWEQRWQVSFLSFFSPPRIDALQANCIENAPETRPVNSAGPSLEAKEEKESPRPWRL